jgi:hypothetical protein
VLGYCSTSRTQRLTGTRTSSKPWRTASGPDMCRERFKPIGSASECSTRNSGAAVSVANTLPANPRRKAEAPSQVGCGPLAFADYAMVLVVRSVWLSLIHQHRSCSCAKNSSNCASTDLPAAACAMQPSCLVSFLLLLGLLPLCTSARVARSLSAVQQESEPFGCGKPYGPCRWAVPEGVSCDGGRGFCQRGYHCAAENVTGPSRCMPVPPNCGVAGGEHSGVTPARCCC